MLLVLLMLMPGGILAALPKVATGCVGLYYETYQNDGNYGNNDILYDPNNLFQDQKMHDKWDSITSYMMSTPPYKITDWYPCWMYATMAVYKSGVIAWAIRAGPQGITTNDLHIHTTCDAAVTARINDVRPTALDMLNQGIVSWTPIYKTCCLTNLCNLPNQTMLDNLFMGVPGGPPITTKAYPYDTSATPSSQSPVPVDPSASPAPGASGAPVDPSASPAPVDPSASPAPGASGASDGSSSSSSSSNTGLIVGVVVGVVALAAVVAGVTWWVVRRHRAVNADAKVIPQGV